MKSPRNIIFTSLLCISATANAQKPPLDSAWALRMVASAEAQKVTHSPPEVVVAVIDTGGDLSHPELARQLWINPGETGLDSVGRDKTTNGIDDDGNGFVDDVHGWNFVDGSHNLADRHGHGTHIGGIIRQIAPEARLMFLKYYDPKANSSASAIMKNTANAIRYATRMGANVINFSAGGRMPHAAEKAAIIGARDAGILFVAAAGNDGLNTDIFPYYPASYGLSNILAVTAVSASKRLLPTSNFGVRSVHLAAPGEAILSALPNGQHGMMTGTSQATAFATGAAALLLAQSRLRLSPEDGIARLTQTAQAPLLDAKPRSPILNAHRALVIQGRDKATTNVVAIDPRLFSPEMAYPLDVRPKR